MSINLNYKQSNCKDIKHVLNNIMSTIAEIKVKLNYSVLNLNTALDKDNQPTEWMRHWDNDNRIAVSLHKDTLAKIKANNMMSNLVLQTEEKTGAQGTYTAIRIVAVAEAEATL
jgi:hypothetical protein